MHVTHFTEPSHYQLLGLPVTATKPDIRQAYYAQVALHQSDNSPLAALIMSKLQLAYRTLLDSSAREIYDLQLVSQAIHGCNYSQRPVIPPHNEADELASGLGSSQIIDEGDDYQWLSAGLGDEESPGHVTAFGAEFEPGTIWLQTRAQYRSKAVEFYKTASSHVDGGRQYHCEAKFFQQAGQDYMDDGSRFRSSVEMYLSAQRSGQVNEVLPNPFESYYVTMYDISVEQCWYGHEQFLAGTEPLRKAEADLALGMAQYRYGENFAGAKAARDKYERGSQDCKHAVTFLKEGMQLFKLGSEQYRDGGRLFQQGNRMFGEGASSPSV